MNRALIIQDQSHGYCYYFIKKINFFLKSWQTQKCKNSFFIKFSILNKLNIQKSKKFYTPNINVKCIINFLTRTILIF